MPPCVHLRLPLLLLLAATLQVKLAATQEALVVSGGELDKAHTTVEAVLFRSRVLEAANAELRAGYVGMEQELRRTKVRMEGWHTRQR